MGSFSKREYIEKSDIDIVIITQNKKFPELAVFERKLKRNIHILTLEYCNISYEFYKNLINGIVLCGYLSKK